MLRGGLELCWSPWGKHLGLDCSAPLLLPWEFPLHSTFLLRCLKVQGLGNRQERPGGWAVLWSGRAGREQRFRDGGGLIEAHLLLSPQLVSSLWQVFEKSPLRVKNFGIWLRYDSRSGTHNMYREYRDLTTAGAVTQCCKPPGPSFRLTGQALAAQSGILPARLRQDKRKSFLGGRWESQGW